MDSLNYYNNESGDTADNEFFRYSGACCFSSLDNETGISVNDNLSSETYYRGINNTPYNGRSFVVHFLSRYGDTEIVGYFEE